MKKLLIKQLIFRIIMAAIACVIISTILGIIYSAPLSNDVAMMQLNGSDGEWLLGESYYKLRSIAEVLAGIAYALVFIPAMKTAIKIFTEINDEQNKENNNEEL